MFIIKNAIKKELKINNDMIENYKKELELLPKGTIIAKKQNSKTYYYIKYRQGKSIKTDYIGKSEQQVVEIKNKINKRKHIEIMLKTFEKERKKLVKIWGEI